MRIADRHLGAASFRKMPVDERHRDVEDLGERQRGRRLRGVDRDGVVVHGIPLPSQARERTRA